MSNRSILINDLHLQLQNIHYKEHNVPYRRV